MCYIRFSFIDPLLAFQVRLNWGELVDTTATEELQERLHWLLKPLASLLRGRCDDLAELMETSPAPVHLIIGTTPFII